MTRIVTNGLLNPTTRVIKNWNQDFRTSDGPNTSAFISLSDLAIPYDSHYTSRIVLPAYTTDYYLNYGLLENATFLLIKVTYNGNYDIPNEDNYDPYYYYEPETYNINYYHEGNSGVTYPIGRLLVLNGSLTNKLAKIYLNNPLDYDVVLDVFHADISAPIPSPPSSAVTISNLYYTDIITDQVICTYSGTTTTTTTIPTTTTTTTSTTLIPKVLMEIVEDYLYDLYIYLSSGDTMGLFDYYYINQWFYAGEDSDFVEFTDISGILIIRFYFELNDTYYGTLKTSLIEPYDHNNGLYFVDINPNDTFISITTTTTTTVIDTTTTTTTTTILSGITIGSTEFIINEFSVTLTGHTIVQNIVPYYTILDIQKDMVLKIIYLSTVTKFYTLKFLTEFDCNQTYSRMLFAYSSYSDGSCRYLTDRDVYKNGGPIICASGYTGVDVNPPIIYYNSSPTGNTSTWIGSGTTVPTYIRLKLYHDGLTGWTINSLKELFIYQVIDCFDGIIPLSEVSFKLYKRSSVIELDGIYEDGLYDATISVTDNANNTITNYITM